MSLRFVSQKYWKSKCDSGENPKRKYTDMRMTQLVPYKYNTTIRYGSNECFRLTSPSTSQINRAQTLRPDQTPHIIEWNGKFLKFIFIFGLKPNSNSSSKLQSQSPRQQPNHGIMAKWLWNSFTFHIISWLLAIINSRMETIFEIKRLILWVKVK